MLELAEKVLRLVGGKSKLSFHALPTNGTKQRQPDISLAKSKLGWEPTVSLEEGLKETVTCFKGLLGR